MWAPFPDFRSPLPKRETMREKRQRVMQERINADSFLKYRMETIADVYSVPLRKMHYDKVIRYSIPNVDQVRFQIKKNHNTVSTIHVLKLGDSGEINVRSKLLGQTIPVDFYRSTKLAAWKEYRFHYLNQEPTTQRGPVLQKNKTFDVSFNDYKSIVNNEVRQARSKELEVTAGRQLKKRDSSFILLKEFHKTPARRGSMSGEFSGTLAKDGYEKFDQAKTERRLSQEARAKHVGFPQQMVFVAPETDSESNATKGDNTRTDSQASGTAPSETAASETAPSETATLSSQPATDSEAEQRR